MEPTAGKNPVQTAADELTHAMARHANNTTLQQARDTMNTLLENREDNAMPSDGKRKQPAIPLQQIGQTPALATMTDNAHGADQAAHNLTQALQPLTPPAPSDKSE